MENAPLPPTVPVLEMRGVTVASSLADYVPVLADVNWKVDAGDFWAIGALPRSGKTALLLTAAGIQRHRDGQVKLFGHALEGLHEAELIPIRRRLSVVLEAGGRIFSDLTVAENVALPYRYHRNCSAEEARERVLALLAAVELQGYADANSRKVPRALFARIGLARALITQPEVLLLDNPLHGLAARQAEWWLGFLLELTRGHAVMGGRPLTLIVATDDLQPWLKFARQFALVRQQSWNLLGDRAAAQKHVLQESRDLLPNVTGAEPLAEPET